MTLISGILLGLYDICTKKALEKTPVTQVLMLYTLFNFILVSFEFINAIHADFLMVLLILGKSFIIFFAWRMSFMAIKGLPISIITPFGTLTPVFTILLGMLFLGERLLYLQIIGIAVMLSAYYLIGRVGAVEVKGLFRNKYLYLMAASTFLSSVTAIIDKISLEKINAGQMQFWFSLFIFLLYMTFFLIERIRQKEAIPVKFNWFIVFMSIFLVLADRIYFIVVSMPVSEISIIMPLRRVSIFISAIVGGLIFGEKNLKVKFLCALLLILGITLVFAG